MRLLSPSLLGLCALLVPAAALAQDSAPDPAGPSEVRVDVTDELGRGDSKRSNGAYTDSYSFHADAGDVIRAELRASGFDTYVMLHSPSGAIETNDDFEGRSDYSRAQITADESGLWMLEVTSFKKKEKGDYSAMVSVWPGAGGQAVSRNKGTAPEDGGSFEFSGALSSSDETLDNGEYRQLFPFEANMGQTIVADLRSTAFDTYVAVISPSGAITQNDDFNSSSDHSQVTVEADEGGTWGLLVTSYKAAETGPFEAQVRVGASSGAGDTDDATLAVEGELADGDFVLDGGEFADGYTFQANAGDELTAVLTSTSFDTFVLLKAPSGEGWSNDDHENSKDRSELTVTATESGEWTLVVTSYKGGESGSYQARVDTVEASSVPQAAASGDDQSGTLASGDSTLDSGEFVDSFTIKGRQGEHLIVDLRSEAFDTYVALRSPSGEVWQNDDHDGSSSRSQVAVELPETGDYQVMVTSYRPGETGAWTAGVTRASGATTEGPRVESGRLAQGDNQLSTGEYIDVITFEGLPGQNVRIDLSSPDFDTYLALVSPENETTENDDAPNEPGHSLIEMTLTEAGTYSVGVTSYKPEETGNYQVSIEVGAGNPTATSAQRDVSRLEAGTPANGVLEDGDETLESGEFRDVYTFEGQAGQNVSVVLQSTDFDPYLGLVTPSDEIIQNDDWESRQDMSRIDLTLPESGRYRVVSTSYRPGDHGAYKIGYEADDSIQGHSAQTAAAVDGDLYGVFVGISDYPGSDNDLDFTAEDARVLQEAFVRGAGMRPENGIVLVDSEATVEGVRQAMATIAARMDDDDRMVFFYSGHGVRLPRQEFQASDPDGQDESLALYDGMATDDAFAGWLDGVPGTSLIVLDACFSGGFAKDVITKPGRMGLFSSHEDVTSAVARKFRAGGYLARFMAEAIGAHAADDGDGQLTALELSQYLYDRYRTDVKAYNESEDAVADAGSGDKTGPQVDYVLSSRNLGYQQLIVDRGGVNPYQVLFHW